MSGIAEAHLTAAKVFSVVTLASRYHLDLRREGAQLVALCPLHDESRPSFYLYPNTNSWYCFGCHRGGDSIALVRAVEGCDFPDAIARLIGTLSMPVPQMVSRAPRLPQPAETPVSVAERRVVLEVATTLYQQQLVDTPAAQRYLRGRGISDGTVASLGLGFCAGQQRAALVAALHARGITEGLANAVGLILPSGAERFAGMIVVPERRDDSITWLVGWSITTKRFMFLPGPRCILGREAITTPWAVLTEGLFDWLSLREWNLPALGMCGSDHIELLHADLPALDRLIVALDADAAGRASLQRILTAFPANARPLLLPLGVKDINELALIANGHQQFCRALGRVLAQKGAITV